MTIQEAIRKMASAGAEHYCKVCTVDSVDEKARTVDCTPIDESAPLLGVNLQANQQSGDGIVQFPAVGSYIVVAFLAPVVAAVVLYERIDKILLKIGQTTTQITGDTITINDGKLGGLVISGKTANKLNALENDLNELKTIFSTWVPVSQDGGAALKSAAATWIGKRLGTTAATDLENEKIKH